MAVYVEWFELSPKYVHRALVADTEDELDACARVLELPQECRLAGPEPRRLEPSYFLRSDAECEAALRAGAVRLDYDQTVERDRKLRRRAEQLADEERAARHDSPEARRARLVAQARNSFSALACLAHVETGVLREALSGMPDGGEGFLAVVRGLSPRGDTE